MNQNKNEKVTTTAPASANIAYLVISLIILLLGIIFVLQNAEETHISFLFWEFKASRAIVLFVTFFMGILIGVFTSIANLIRKDRVIKKQVKEIEKLQYRVDALEQELDNGSSGREKKK